jgi:Leu/Phe-tRNA-protein transferase
MCWNVSTIPPYNPDPSPCDFHVFNSLRKELKGHRFRSDEDVKAVAVQCFQQQDREFFERGSWGINGMYASASMATIFNDLYSFAQSNP